MMFSNIEARYYQFLQEKGYLSSENRSKLFSVYLDYIDPGDHVLDVACGDGLFMEQARDHGCTVEGVDADPMMVEIARSKGFTVAEQDALEFLSEVSAEQYDCVFSSNFIEHLTAEQALSFMQNIVRALKPGGTVIIATPNPTSIIVHLYEFWRDLTHVRLYNAQLLEFLLWHHGLETVESTTNIHSRWDAPFLQSDNLHSPTATPATPPEKPHIETAQDAVVSSPSEPVNRHTSKPEDEALTDVESLEPLPDREAASEAAKYGQMVVQKALENPLFLPATSATGKIRQQIAARVYAITRELDLRLSRAENLLALHEQSNQESLSFIADELHTVRTHMQQAEAAIMHLQNSTQQINATMQQTHAEMSQLESYTQQVQQDVANTLGYAESFSQAIQAEIQSVRFDIERLQSDVQRELNRVKEGLEFIFQPRELYVVGRKPE